MPRYGRTKPRASADFAANARPCGATRNSPRRNPVRSPPHPARRHSARWRHRVPAHPPPVWRVLFPARRRWARAPRAGGAIHGSIPQCHPVCRRRQLSQPRWHRRHDARTLMQPVEVRQNQQGLVQHRAAIQVRAGHPPDRIEGQKTGCGIAQSYFLHPDGGGRFANCTERGYWSGTNSGQEMSRLPYPQP